MTEKDNIVTDKDLDAVSKLFELGLTKAEVDIQVLKDYIFTIRELRKSRQALLHWAKEFRDALVEGVYLDQFDKAYLKSLKEAISEAEKMS